MQFIWVTMKVQTNKWMFANLFLFPLSLLFLRFFKIKNDFIENFLKKALFPNKPAQGA